MDFDFSQISTPFRMQPGLRRMAGGDTHLTALVKGSTLFAEKRAVWQAGQSRHVVAGFDPENAINSIAACARQQGLSASFDAENPLELAFEEDFAVLDAASRTVPWLCVCTPSHWAPEDKIGQSLAQIHGPVADNTALLAAMQGLVQLVTQGGRWERFVWTFTPSPRHDQHPRRQPRQPWPAGTDPDAFAAQCFLRVERQTFFPVTDAPGQPTRQAVFTIRVMLEPLAVAAASQADAARLHDALASMTDTVLAYKNLVSARPVLLSWLARRAAS